MTYFPQTFIGKDAIHNEPWHRSETEPPVTDPYAYSHPRHYIADEGLIAAVNTALLLNKPLLVTGNPGTGKSDLAERIAWEFQLGPVLRFEAQSLSEANDLFYRFDLVGRLAESRLQADQQHPRTKKMNLNINSRQNKIHPLNFVEFGPFGKAILRASQRQTDDQPLLQQLRQRAFPNGEARQEAQASVVLIDEIDKAGRDFPNDLLNGIERMEFKIRELDNLSIRVQDKQQGLHPIVIITSNLERDLPQPFLRRCAFYHIDDPSPELLAEIVRVRVFPERKDLSRGQLPIFYQQLLGFFCRLQEQDNHVYKPGPTEIIEASRVLVALNADEKAGLTANLDLVRRSVSAIIKHREDLKNFETVLNQCLPLS